jgi:RNA polymerase sigma-70 factor (ECF subfamily)
MTEEQLKNKILTHQDDILNFSLKFYKGDLEKAKDLSQDSIIKAIRYYKQIKEFYNIKSWLYTIVKNTYLNETKKTKNKNTFYVGEIYSDFNSLPHKKITIQNNDSISNMNIEFIMNGIEKISPANKESLCLFMNDYSIKEISVKLNINISTVKSKIFHGRKQLQKKLSPLLKELNFEIRK